jgi:parallel beta-helix repeat protein
MKTSIFKRIKRGIVIMVIVIILTFMPLLSKALASRLEISDINQILCGQVITENLILENDFGPCSGDGIIIDADGIYIDGNGHKIIGSDNGIGITIFGRSHVTIEKTFIIGFSTGIDIRGGVGNVITMNVLRQNSIAISISSYIPYEFANSNTLTRNIIDGNELGIYISSSNNLIYHNIIFSNDDQILDLGQNSWMDPEYKFGNYWGNYWGEDNGDNGRIAGDFIGDTRLPHEGVDNYPLLDPAIIMRFGPVTCGDWWQVGSMWLVWRGGWSPVDIRVMDPFGRVLSKNENQMGVSAFYAEDDQVIPGETMVHVLIIPCLDKSYNGTYDFQMTGLGNLNYWLTHIVSFEGNEKIKYSIQGNLGINEIQDVKTNIKTYIDQNGNTQIEAQLVVPIDIKPGSFPNCFNNNGHGVVPVAIMSNKVFNATRVNPSTLTIDGVLVKPKDHGTVTDVNGDGLLDLVVHFLDVNGTYKPGVTIGTINGQTYENVPIMGKDSICIVP